MRPADDRDAHDVARRSITELCGPDHGGDQAVLARWLANKAEADSRRWCGDPSRSVFVADLGDGRIAGVGMAARRSEIMLNHVAPPARFRQMSKALMARTEAGLRALGVAEATLLGSQVARPFRR